MRRAILYQLEAEGSGSLEGLVEEVRLAEQLGIDGAWCLPGAGESGDWRLGAPVVWLAALADRTHRIRLGWGLAGLLPPTRPPIRIAEQAASLDLASAGRLDVAFLPGVGHALQHEPDWDEGVRMLVDMWAAPRFSWTSERFEVPPVDVVPKPRQQPHPRLWMIGWSAEHARLAGGLGLALLDVSGGQDEQLEGQRAAYLAAWEESEAIDRVGEAFFAAALDGEGDGEALARLRVWEDLGFDQAVLRLALAEGDGERRRDLIRSLESGSVALH